MEPGTVVRAFVRGLNRGGSKRLSAAARAGLLLLAGAALALRFMAPVGDPDIFWHLKTGEWIAAHRALPVTDPFAYTTPVPVTADQRFVLTSYWIGQLVLQALCSAGGLRGIVMLRFVMAGLIAAVMIRRREGDAVIYSGLLATLAVVIGIYPLERPQTWSFLFFAVLFGLLDAVRKAESGRATAARAAAAVPVLMLLWANTHAGALPGQCLIVLVLGVEAARCLAAGAGGEAWGRLRLLALSGSAGLAASLVNPNGWHAAAFTRLLFKSGGANQEMWSSLEAFRVFASPASPALWFLGLFAVAALIADRRRVDPVDVAILAAVGYFSLAHVRYMAYFPLAALPAAARHASRSRFAPIFAVAALVAGTAVCGAFLREGLANRAFLEPGGRVNGYAFPEAAADFIEREEPARNLYNNVNWGGYLIWRLGPKWQVFVDGRLSGPDVFAEAQAVDSAAAEDDNGLPRWKSILARRGIACALIPVYSTLGVVYPLVSTLLTDESWVPVHVGFNEAVFVLRNEGNRRIIGRWALPRQVFVARLLDSLAAIVAARPTDPAPRIARGDILTGLSRREEARREYEAALRLAPLHPIARQRLGAR